MKKKASIALLAMLMALAAGCGEKKETAVPEAETEAREKAEDENGSTTEMRLVSVDSVEKYITLGEYKGIVLDRSVQITEEDIDAEIQRVLTDSMEEVTQKGSAVENGDMVTINYVGTKDGVAFEGGSAENYDLLIGSGLMIPGFEEGILGMKKGDTKDVAVTFPENYRSTDLAGQEAVFQITLLSFKRAPELTDEWVAKNTDSATVEEYRSALGSQLEEAAQAEADSNLESTGWMTVFHNSEVKEYPQKDLDEAVAAFKRQTEEYAKQADMELQDFVESQGVSMEDFEAQAQQYAQLKVKQKLIIQGIFDAEGISLEDPECLAIQETLVQEYGAGDMAALIDTYGQDAVDETIGLLRVKDFIFANANIQQGAASEGQTEHGKEEAGLEDADQEQPIEEEDE